MKTYLKNVPPGLAWQTLVMEKKKTSLLWLFRQNFDIIDGRKIFIKLSMIK